MIGVKPILLGIMVNGYLLVLQFFVEITKGVALVGVLPDFEANVNLLVLQYLE